LEKAENGEQKYTQLTVSEAISFLFNLNKAWRQVTSSTIFDCSEKAHIIEDIQNDELNEIKLNSDLSIIIESFNSK